MQSRVRAHLAKNAHFRFNDVACRRWSDHLLRRDDVRSPYLGLILTSTGRRHSTGELPCGTGACGSGAGKCQKNQRYPHPPVIERDDAAGGGVLVWSSALVEVLKWIGRGQCIRSSHQSLGSQALNWRASHLMGDFSARFAQQSGVGEMR